MRARYYRLLLVHVPITYMASKRSKEDLVIKLKSICIDAIYIYIYIYIYIDTHTHTLTFSLLKIKFHNLLYFAFDVVVLVS